MNELESRFHEVLRLHLPEVECEKLEDAARDLAKPFLEYTIFFPVEEKWYASPFLRRSSDDTVWEWLDLVVKTSKGSKKE